MSSTLGIIIFITYLTSFVVALPEVSPPEGTHLSFGKDSTDMVVAWSNIAPKGVSSKAWEPLVQPRVRYGVSKTGLTSIHTGVTTDFYTGGNTTRFLSQATSNKGKRMVTVFF